MMLSFGMLVQKYTSIRGDFMKGLWRIIK